MPDHKGLRPACQQSSTSRLVLGAAPRSVAASWQAAASCVTGLLITVPGPDRDWPAGRSIAAHLLYLAESFAYPRFGSGSGLQLESLQLSPEQMEAGRHARCRHSHPSPHQTLALAVRTFGGPSQNLFRNRAY